IIRDEPSNQTQPSRIGRIGRFLGYTLLSVIPFLVAGAIVWHHGHTPDTATPLIAQAELIPIRPPSATALENMFSSEDYSWPPQDAVPPYAIQSLPYGLDTLNQDEKKSVFFRALLPIVLAENLRIWNQRVFLLHQFGQGGVDPQSDAGQELAAIADQYKVAGDLNDPKVRETLLNRVDIVPVALVLAQAAQESGWGTSRFALEGNNLFGIWTWDADQGSVPVNRPGDANHLVRVYPDVQTSVRAYLHNINIGFAYVDFRNMRARMRANGKPLDALALAGALNRYSITGDAYIENIRDMIRSNALGKLSNLSLSNVGE
ncbi:MAG: glucosaminidase domain-containing protein, partial [Gammaproteobacteria bacterium]